MSDIATRVTEIITGYVKQRGLPLPDGGLDVDKNLSDYGLESLDEVAIIAEIENELNVTIDDARIAEINTLRDLIDLIVATQAA